MSPILVRPVREQLEHDRVIRLLQAKYKRKFDVGINPGPEQLVSAGTGASAEYPDLVLHSQRGRKLMGVVEVETAESVNHLEAMSQWVALSRLRAPFHLYVPTASVDPARRMCGDMGIPVSELWAYHLLGDQIRFTLVQRSTPASRARSAAGRKAPGATRTSASGRKAAKAPSAGRTAKAAKPARKATRPSGSAAKKAVRKTAAKKKAAKKTTRTRSR